MKAINWMLLITWDMGATVLSDMTIPPTTILDMKGMCTILTMTHMLTSIINSKQWIITTQNITHMNIQEIGSITITTMATMEMSP